jgi:hypothetical protein
MATTTPNYGWDVPTSTDYVKDGATAIETLGDDIDATLYGLVGTNTKVGMQLLSTTTLSGASTTISSINQNFADLEIWVYGMTNLTNSGFFRLAPNGSTTLVHGSGTVNAAGSSALSPLNNDYFLTSYFVNRTGGLNAFKIRIENYANTSFYKSFSATTNFINSSSNSTSENYGGGIKTASAITSLVFSNTGGNFDGGTVKVWGCN